MTLTPDRLTTDASVARAKSRWWLEIIYILVLYGLYSAVRNYHGALLSGTTAVRHAYEIMNAQEALGLISEVEVQRFFLRHGWSIKAFNIYYGTAHFAVTVGVLVWLFHKQVPRYVHWRNVIFATTGLALIGYIIYPLAPPRLLPAELGFVDTLETVGGLWNFDSGTVQQLSNQYAAMPSLHVGWALWSAFAIMPVLQHAWSKVLIGLYPALTTLAIVVTGNHFWLDVVGGLVVFALGYVLATWIEGRRRKRHLLTDRETRPVDAGALNGRVDAGTPAISRPRG